MPTIVLDTKPDRSTLQGFAVAMAVLLGGTVATSAFLVGAGGAAALGIGLAAALATGIFGWVWPHRAEYVYRFWNRVARAFARRAQSVVLAVCFHTVVRAAASSARSDAAAEREHPRWLNRETLPAPEYPLQAPGLSGDPRPRGGDLVAWALATRRPWVLFLAPFLVLVAVYDTRGQSKPPASIYTLY